MRTVTQTDMPTVKTVLEQHWCCVERISKETHYSALQLRALCRDVLSNSATFAWQIFLDDKTLLITKQPSQTLTQMYLRLCKLLLLRHELKHPCRSQNVR